MSKYPDNFELFSVFEKNEWLEKALAEAEGEAARLTWQLAALRHEYRAYVVGWHIDEDGTRHDPYCVNCDVNLNEDETGHAPDCPLADEGLAVLAREYRDGILEEVAQISDEIGKREVFRGPINEIDWESTEAMMAMRGFMSDRPIGPGFNEWMARDICSYVDALLAERGKFVAQREALRELVASFVDWAEPYNKSTLAVVERAEAALDNLAAACREFVSGKEDCVAEAIDSVQLFVRFNDFTSDRKPGYPIEICRYDADGGPEVIAWLPVGVDERNELQKLLKLERARAAIDAISAKTTEGQ